MGPFKCNNKNNDCGTPCNESELCECPNCCPNEDDDEGGCPEAKKKACCKPGCSPRKPCVSCIKCGVKPQTCKKPLPPKRTCVLSKPCCKDPCPKDSPRERVIKIKSKCIIEKSNNESCETERSETGELDVKITFNEGGNECTPKASSESSSPCPQQASISSCAKPPPCEEPCKPKCRPPTPPVCRKAQPCSCDSCCTTSSSAVRFKSKEEIIPSAGDCGEQIEDKCPPKTCGKCKKSGQCTPKKPCCKTECCPPPPPPCCPDESNTIFISDTASSFPSICPTAAATSAYFMPNSNVTKCWSNPLPCPCGSPSCRNSMMIFP